MEAARLDTGKRSLTGQSPSRKTAVEGVDAASAAEVVGPTVARTASHTPLRPLTWIAAAILILSPIAGTGRAAERVGAERCRECHEREYRHWSRTTHAVLLTESEDDGVLDLVEEIPDALGIGDVETDAACAKCHFSEYRDASGEQRLAPIDCESCHGKASGWIEVHGDYGSKNGVQIDDPAAEDPLHRKRRLEEAIAEGMAHPSTIVGITQNCFECHVGPGERIINVGGHAAGSDFELVTHFEEAVRHNYQQVAPHANMPLSEVRRRQLYVVGRALDLEYSLRGLARATEEGRYLRSMKARVAASRKELEKILRAMPISEVATILGEVAQLEVREGNATRTLEVARRIHNATIEFAAKHDGEHLSDLDPLIPASEAPRS